MTFVYALESDMVAKAATNKKERDKIGAVHPNIDCKVCLKQHKKRECKYQCKHCQMFSYHKAENCLKKYPELKRGRGNKRDRSKSRQRSKSRDRPRYDRPRYGDTTRDGINRVGDREESGYREERDRG